MAAPIRKAGVFAGAAAGLVVALILFLCDPSRTPIYPVCPFHRLTGLDCPGCGGLRAMHALLHGNVIAALHLNLALVLSLPLLGWLGLRFAYREFSGNAEAFPIKPAWLWFYLAFWIAFGVARNLPFLAAFAP